MYTYTIAKLMRDLSNIAGRAVIDERLNFLGVRVPFWRVEAARLMLAYYMPVGVGWSIKRFTVIEHFTQWCVTFNTLYGQPREYKKSKA